MPSVNQAAILWSLALLVLPQAAIAGATRTAKEYAKVDAFVAAPLGMEAHQTLDRMRSLEKVLQETSRVTPNRYRPGSTNDSRTFVYDGLTLHVVFVGSNPNHGLLWETDITKSRWTMTHGLKVGASVSDVQAILGEPDERSPDHIKYCGDRACGTFHLRNNRVTRAVFSNPPE